jgi:hypothetical protein
MRGCKPPKLETQGNLRDHSPSSSLIAFRYDFIRHLTIDCLCTECHTFPTNICRSINYLLADLGRWGLFIMCNHGLLCASSDELRLRFQRYLLRMHHFLLCYASGDLPRSKLFGRSFLDLFDLQEQLSGQRRLQPRPKHDSISHRKRSFIQLLEHIILGWIPRMFHRWLLGAVDCCFGVRGR